MHALYRFFRANPQRFCVLGVWSHLIGTCATFYFLVGRSWWVGAVGIGLIVFGEVAKVHGRDLFAFDRIRRHSRALHQAHAGRTVGWPSTEHRLLGGNVQRARRPADGQR